MRTERLNPHWFLLRLVTSAGAYVKEFVHGDMGRTQPNVGSLLGDDGGADILQLDVVNVLSEGEACFAGSLDELLPTDAPDPGAGWELRPGDGGGAWVRAA